MLSSSWRRLPACVACALVVTATAAASQPEPRPPVQGPILKELVLEGSTVYRGDDVLWLLNISLGNRLPASPDDVAAQLQQRYSAEGYTAARVVAEYDAASGRLTLRIDEGRIDDIQFEGLRPRLVEPFRARFAVRPGDVYNRRTVERALDELLAPSEGAIVARRDAIDLKTIDGRRLLVIPIDEKHGRFRIGSSSEAREDFFSPVDGFDPNVSLEFTRLDPQRFNHTFFGGYLSYKFARDHPGYSIGIQQRLVGAPQVFVGAEWHDLTTSDDLWRLSTTEQSTVALLFKNTFRDYYQRRGLQVFAAVRPHRTTEFVASFRRDRHETLANESDFSVFRDDHEFRPNPPIDAGRLRSLVLAFEYDSRGAGGRGPGGSFGDHLLDDPYRGSRRQGFGWRVDWTSEIAGHGFGGDYEFDRHILNARAYVPLSPRQSVAGRAVLGGGGGTVPPERRFALGGIGTVHGYRFKEAVGERMVLFNAEYRLDLLGPWQPDSQSGLRALVFYDAGRVTKSLTPANTDWLGGLGVGLQGGPIRVEFGYRTSDIPKSLQILVRLGQTF